MHVYVAKLCTKMFTLREMHTSSSGGFLYGLFLKNHFKKGEN